jgi:hypothetical protein
MPETVYSPLSFRRIPVQGTIRLHRISDVDHLIGINISAGRYSYYRNIFIVGSSLRDYWFFSNPGLKVYERYIVC